MLCCSLRHARRSDALALLVATFGTLVALPHLPGGHAPVHTQTVVLGAAPAAGQNLGACARGFSSQDSGVGLLHGRVAPDPDFVAAVCEAEGGADCEIDDRVPVETAMCVAEQHVLGEGGAFSAYLAFDRELGTVVWRVSAAQRVAACMRERVSVVARTGEMAMVEVLRDPFCE